MKKKQIFVKNRKFSQKSKFLSKKNKFCQKSKIFVKIPNFCQNYNFLSKIQSIIINQIFVKIPYLGQKCIFKNANFNFLNKNLECKNGELPLGWEEVVDPRYGKLFINHLDRQVQVEDPRTQYLGQKEKMIANFISIVKNNSSVNSSSSKVPHSPRDHLGCSNHHHTHRSTPTKGAPFHYPDRCLPDTHQQLQKSLKHARSANSKKRNEQTPNRDDHDFGIGQPPIDDMKMLEIEIDQSKQRVERLR